MTPCCAHSKITHKTIKDLHGISTDKYYCLICDTEFIIKPKEKPMENKVIFESVDSYKSIMKDCGFDKNDIDKSIYYAQLKGYIRKSAVEEAEDRYNNWILNELNDTTHDKQHEAIQYLKAENERLKK